MLRSAALGSVLLFGLVSTATAEEPPALVRVEAKVAHGLAVGGGPSESSWRRGPVHVGAAIERAVREVPWTSVYGGLLVEGRDRLAFGISGGMRTALSGGLRASAGGIYLAVPKEMRMAGGTAGLGRCVGKTRQLCLDVEGVVWVWGRDLPEGRVAGQVQLALGLGFDAF